jgi:hypothetical protein
VVMMKRKTQIKLTALILTLVYFALSSLVMVRAGEQAGMHEHGTNHAAHHTSFLCNWMCAASSVIPSADLKVTQSVDPSFEKLPIHAELFLSNLSVFYVYIRPPPAFLA